MICTTLGSDIDILRRIKVCPYVGINRRQEMSRHMFRKYVGQQFLIVGFQMLHFFFLFRGLELP